MFRNRDKFALIFIASLSALSYEICLIRIFSISLWYHFAFMVISIAMLGIAASGTLLSLYPKLKDSDNIPFYCYTLALSIPLSYLLANNIPFDPARLSWERMQLLYISLYYMALCIPFFFFGLIVSTAYSTMSERSGYVYAADITGAGTGSLAAFLLLYAGTPENVVFIMPSFIALILLFRSNKKIRSFSLVLIILYLSILSVHPKFIQLRISQYKPLELALKFPGAERLQTRYSPYSRVDVFKSPAVRFAPGLSFKYLNPLPEQTGVSIDAGDIYAMTDERERDKLDFVYYLPSALPHLLSRKNDVLILEPKAGLPALIAKQCGAKNIYKVDSNPLVIKTVREYGASLSSLIYDENVWSGLGRSWLMSENRNFDVIDISIMGSMPSGSFGFSEDYRYTIEAFREYIKHLKQDGFLSLNLFIIPPPRIELRLLNTIAEAFDKSGLLNLSEHVAAIRSWGSLTLIMKRSEMTQNDIRQIKKFSQDMKFDLVYYPGIKEKESNRYIKTPKNEYFHAFQGLINPGTRRQFVSGYLFDIEPVHDENPFFHYYLKLQNVKEIYRVMGKKWQYFLEEGYLLPVLFMQVVFLSILLVLIPLAKNRSASTLNLNLVLSLSYFAFIGTGFMFIEITFIQKMILALENPTYAASTVIASILIGSGMGSLLSQHMEKLRRPTVLLVLAGIVLSYDLLLPFLIQNVTSYSLPVKVIFVFFLLTAAGIFMGIPFPLGISLLGKTASSLIPWAWAVNGCFSVLAPILAIMLALSAGFSAVILIGALMYLSAFLALLRIHRGARSTI